MIQGGLVNRAWPRRRVSIDFLVHTTFLVWQRSLYDGAVAIHLRKGFPASKVAATKGRGMYGLCYDALKNKDWRRWHDRMKWSKSGKPRAYENELQGSNRWWIVMQAFDWPAHLWGLSLTEVCLFSLYSLYPRSEWVGWCPTAFVRWWQAFSSTSFLSYLDDI